MKTVLYFIVCLLFISSRKIHGQNKSTEIEYLHVNSQIQSRFAVTLITSKVHNVEDRAQEIFFQAQLPEEAFITNFSMIINNTVMYGDVKEKKAAKEVYDKAVERGQSAGLVAEIPRETNTFQISVNVGAKGSVVFNLTYQEILKRTHGVYKHVINLQPQEPISDLKVDVYISELGKIKDIKVPKFGAKVGEKNNLELLQINETEKVDIDQVTTSGDGTSHAKIAYVPVQPRNGTLSGQLVVLYDVERDNTGGQIQLMDGYFVHFFAPSGLNKGPKVVIFVLDESGSMIGRKFDQLKVAMKRILTDLDEKDRFNILMFSDELTNWKAEAVQANEENKRLAKEFVESRRASGGTDIFGSLIKAFDLLTREGTNSFSSMIVFLTDGEPTVGVTNNDVIVNNVTSSNVVKKFVIHSLAFGRSADYRLVQRISNNNNGIARKVYEDSDADLQLTGFYAEIASPLLTNITVNYLNETTDVSTLLGSVDYNLYQGGELMIVGKLNTTEPAPEPVPVPAGTESSVPPKLPPEAINPLFGAEITARSASGPVHFQAKSIARRHCWGPRRPCPWPWPRPPRPGPGPFKPSAEPPILPAGSVGGFVERMWAYLTIKKLLKQYELEPKKPEASKSKALRMSLKYKFVTSLTSMAVVQPELNVDQSKSNDTQQNATSAEIVSSVKPRLGAEFRRMHVHTSRQGGYSSSGARPMARGGGGHSLNFFRSRAGGSRGSMGRFGHRGSPGRQGVHVSPPPPPPQWPMTSAITGIPLKNTVSGSNPILVSIQVVPECHKCVENLEYLNHLDQCLRANDSRAVFFDLEILGFDNSDPENATLKVLPPNPNSPEPVPRYPKAVKLSVEQFRDGQSNKLKNSANSVKFDGRKFAIFFTGKQTSEESKSYIEKLRVERPEIFLVHLTDQSESEESIGWRSLVKNQTYFYTSRDSYEELCAALKA